VSDAGGSTDLEGEAFPTLSHQQMESLKRRATPQDVVAGDELFKTGDRDYDFIVIETGAVEIIRGETPDSAEQVVASHGARRFLGELNMLTGQSAYLTARVREPGRVHRITPEGFRRLMAEDAQLSDLILHAFLARRQELQTGEGRRSVEILGTPLSSVSHTLRNWAARQHLPHEWIDFDTPAGQNLAGLIEGGVTAADLPLVVLPTGDPIRRATAGEVAERLGLSFQAIEGRVYDVVIVGAGPGGLAAAVYGASEGLDTMLVDEVVVGGQAVASSRIENYLGFPFGLSGAELTEKGELQAQKFGAHVSTPCRVASMCLDDGHLQLKLADATQIRTHSVVIATGARYRTLPLERWSDFDGAGIYFAATKLEADTCNANPVTVVGGANSAGQASIYLADRGSPVRLVVRGPSLTKEMSTYLVDRILAHPRITVMTETEVTALYGETSLKSIRTSTRGVAGEPCECWGLFCFIGAQPATGWLDGAVSLDADGFVLTDSQLDDAALPDAWAMLGRRPLPFETSVPGVFAVGDVRHGSMKRVAAAVGEGASAIRSVHAAIAPLV
jgi:thioredoxin reductase (NADPH)